MSFVYCHLPKIKTLESPINAIPIDNLLFMPPDKLADFVFKSFCNPTKLAIRIASFLVSLKEKPLILKNKKFQSFFIVFVTKY